MDNEQMDMGDITDIQEYKSHNRLLQETDTQSKEGQGRRKLHKAAFGLIPVAVLIAILLYYGISIGNTEVSAAENAAIQNAAVTSAAAEIDAYENEIANISTAADKSGNAEEEDNAESVTASEKQEDETEKVSDALITDASDSQIPAAAVEAGEAEREELQDEDNIVAFESAAQAYASSSSDSAYTSTSESVDKADVKEAEDESTAAEADTEDSIIGIQFEENATEEVRWQLTQDEMSETAREIMDRMGVSANYSSNDPEVPEYLTKTFNQEMVMSLTDEELNALTKLVEAEAPAEDIYGKILVANVVLNRVLSDEMADTVNDVIYQKIGGSAQFSSTTISWYWNSISVSNSTREAVARALSGEDYSQGAVYFYAWKSISSSKAKWFNNNTVYLFTHGGHKFYAP